MKTQTIFYIWLVTWFCLEAIGAPIFVYIDFEVGLLLMTLGAAIVLIPFIANIAAWEHKKINEYFSKHKTKVD